MSSRRNFIKNIGVHSAAFSMMPFAAPLNLPELTQLLPSSDYSTEEDFWLRIQEAYTVSRSRINLNNGGVSPQPRFVQEAFDKYNAMSNEAPSYYMWRQLEPTRLNIRTDLAKLLGCEREEVVINRNTTEALDTIIFGLDLKKGDEIVLSPYDYPNMRNAWEQRKNRDGIVLRYADFELPASSEKDIVDAFVKEMNSNTRLVHVTHMINYNGQVLPVKEISDEAKKRDLLLMIDGAHTFAHIDYNIKELNCDFFGTSLHKWLCSPFGTGMMYINKDRISDIWPFAPTDAIDKNNIRKFEAMGTRSVPAEIAVGQAVLFHNNIGIDRKYNRLKKLTDYWTSDFEENERFVSYTPKLQGKYGALYTFGIDGMTGNEVSTYLQKHYNIITSPVNWRNIKGCRVSPHVYTSYDELDKLKDGIRKMINA